MADTIVTLSADDKALMNALKRIMAGQGEVDAGFKKVKKSSQGITLDGVVDGMAKWAAGFATVATAGQAVSAMLDEQIRKNQESLTLYQDLAKAQQEASKNLAGVTPEKISSILQQQVPEIALEAGFKDLPALTKALGSTASIVGEELAGTVVATAAKFEKLTPENLQTTSTATADLVKATGVKDAREAMALLLSAGSVARPEELPRLAMGAARSVNAGVLAAPGQDRIAAAKESAALFSMLSVVDKSGESASTATVQLIAQLNELFKGREDDPGTTMGRLQKVQGDEKLRAAFLKDMKGEAIFKPLFEALTNASSEQSKQLTAALSTVTTDVGVFNEAMKTLDVTPQQKIANATAAAQTAVEVNKMNDRSGASMSSMAAITQEAMRQSSYGVSSSLQNWMQGGYKIEQSYMTPKGFAEARIETLQQRRAALEGLDQTPENLSKLQVVDAAIASIQKIRDEVPTLGVADAVREQNEEVKKQTELLQQIANGVNGKAPQPAIKSDKRDVPTKEAQRAQLEQGRT